jgi:hypothetical protein
VRSVAVGQGAMTTQDNQIVLGVVGDTVVARTFATRLSARTFYR